MTDDTRLGPRPLSYPIKAAAGPCAGCGKPIQPGQLYLVTGPYHFGCSKEAPCATPAAFPPSQR